MNDRADRQGVIEVLNPYTGEVVGTVPKASIEDIRRAFALARAYRPTLTRYERAAALQKAVILLRSRAEEASDLITRESGLSKKDSTYEVGRAAMSHLQRHRGAEGRRPGVLLRSHAPWQEPPRVHAPRAAAGRDLGDHSLQPSDEPGGAQGGAVDRDQ